jgi:hypothetical protein
VTNGLCVRLAGNVDHYLGLQTNRDLTHWALNNYNESNVAQSPMQKVHKFWVCLLVCYFPTKKVFLFIKKNPLYLMFWLNSKYNNNNNNNKKINSIVDYGVLV